MLILLITSIIWGVWVEPVAVAIQGQYANLKVQRL